MLNYDLFKEDYYNSKVKIRDFTKKEIDLIPNHLGGIKDFLRSEGLAKYENNFFWTCLPNDFHDILNYWGLKGNDSYVFFRSAFGGALLKHDKKLYMFDPIFNRLFDWGQADEQGVYMIINYNLRLDVFKENCFHKQCFSEIKDASRKLKEDEIFGFVPAIPFGGSLEDSKKEIVKFKEHLMFLCQLFEDRIELM